MESSEDSHVLLRVRLTANRAWFRALAQTTVNPTIEISVFEINDDNDSIVPETTPEIQTVTVTDSNVSLNQSFGVIPTPTCAVCLSSIINREPSSTLCGHIFCRACIAKAIETFHCCPICGRPLTEADFHPIYFQ